MPPKSDYVQRLLQAEENRNRVIAEARQRKTQRLKQAKADAEAAVADFKKSEDTELARYKTTISQGAEAEKMALVNEAERDIEKMRKVSSQRMPNVVGLMVGLITTVPQE